MRIILVVLTAACLAAVSPAEAKDENRDSVVKIHATHRLPDFVRPWTKATARKSAGSGVIIDGKRIITNAHVVQYASQIFVQPNQSTDKLPAKVEAIALEVDLALLKLEDESFFERRRALPLADGLPDIKDTVNVYGYPIGGEQLSVTEGIVSRIEYSHFYYGSAGLRIQVDAALNPGNSGGPAVADGKIAGLVFSKMLQAENIGYLIAVEEINAFLEDVKDGTYHGKPRMFDELQSTQNEALRAKLALDKDGGGVMVTDPYSDDETYPLRAWDVITHIGPHAIDSQGNVQLKEDLRLGFHYWIPKLVENGTIPLTVARDKKSLEVRLPVSVDADRLLPFLKGKYPRYFIFGPMLFTAATQDLAVRLGGAPQTYLRATNSPLITRQFDHKAFEDEELVVLGARLFPHRISKGYGNATFAVVTHVGEVPIRNLRHLVETLRDAKDEFIVLKIAGKYETLVFRRRELIDSTEEILDNEGIRRQYSDDLREVWKK